jgi:hypothetical protein
MKKASLKQLRERFECLSKDRSAVWEALRELDIKKQIPKLKKAYEGKFWRYKNAYSSTESWWAYSRCKEIVDERKAIFDSFEIMPDQIRICNDKELDYFMCQEEITSEEYYEKFMEVWQILNGMILK